MSGRRVAFATAAEGFVGVPFRFRGRDQSIGLDCVGLVLAALQRIGSSLPAIEPYSLRQRHFAAQLPAASAVGFRDAHGPAETGDLLLLKSGPAQLHLAIVGRGDTLIHAHAGLRRVVLTPTTGPLLIERHWRLLEN